MVLIAVLVLGAYVDQLKQANIALSRSTNRHFIGAIGGHAGLALDTYMMDRQQ